MKNNKNDSKSEKDKTELINEVYDEIISEIETEKFTIKDTENQYKTKETHPIKKNLKIEPVDLNVLHEDVDEVEENPLNIIDDIPMLITVQVGKKRMSVRELLQIKKGSVICLDRMADEPVDVLVNGKLFAKAEIILIDDSFGVSLLEIVRHI